MDALIFVRPPLSVVGKMAEAERQLGQTAFGFDEARVAEAVKASCAGEHVRVFHHGSFGSIRIARAIHAKIKGTIERLPSLKGSLNIADHVEKVWAAIKSVDSLPGVVVLVDPIVTEAISERFCGSLGILRKIVLSPGEVTKVTSGGEVVAIVQNPGSFRH
jgi:hypothetical protein